MNVVNKFDMYRCALCESMSKKNHSTSFKEEVMILLESF